MSIVILSIINKRAINLRKNFSRTFETNYVIDIKVLETLYKALKKHFIFYY